MKKLLFILTLFVSVSSFAQTKEETIAWINTYASEYLIIDEGNGVKNYYEIKVDDFGKILTKLERRDKGKKFYEKTKEINAKDITLIKEIKYQSGAGGIKVFTKENKDSQLYFEGTSYDDVLRVYKALVHYASFYGYKEKAARDTF